MYLLTILTILILISGFFENIYHQQKIKQIPIRIHVNGTRGKSTTVRLIASSLREAGYRVLAKTTGTSPRIILENGAEETINRRGAANIIEQKYFIQKAVQRKSEAVVLECMAVHPETQWVSEHQLIQSTIGVITNVREDHQDVYGPDLKEAASSLKLTIPQDGYLVTAERNFFSLFQQEGNKLKTECILVKSEETMNKRIKQSENFYFQDNVAIALKVSQLLGINKKIALQGILKTHPDPGALTIHRMGKRDKLLWFINAFAANDRESILLIFDKVMNQLLPKSIYHSPKIALINHRDDRITRTIQFDKMLSRDIYFDTIILVGPTSQLSQRKLIQFGYPAEKIHRIGRKETVVPRVVERLFRLIEKNGVVFGLGNTRGFGLELIKYVEENGEKV